ncbi:CinA family protein [Niveibacterium sp. SC-1]|uniref:CinA family protein n=1 Tax=Niveibacterium sp. SC-1 TaxID=3135646 RepID=UPI00311FBAB2
MMDRTLLTLARDLGDWLAARRGVLATAESCTGGGIAEAVTAISGSSAWFDRGWVTYSNEAKMEMLGVQAHTLQTRGAVSEAVALEMVMGALLRSRASHAVAVSGVAGPTGGSAEKPVGMVCIAWGERDAGLRVQTFHFDGDREAVRRQAVEAALRGLMVGDATAFA